MKQKTKAHIKKLNIEMQINSRPTKVAKGMSYTAERRARRTNHSIFYAVLAADSTLFKNPVAGTLRAYGTLDSLRFNGVKRYKLRKWNQEYTKRNSKK